MTIVLIILYNMNEANDIPYCLKELLRKLGCTQYQINIAERLDLTTKEILMNFSETAPEEIVRKSNIKDARNKEYPFLIVAVCAIGVRCHEIMASTLPHNTPREWETISLPWLCARITKEELIDISRRKLQLYRIRLEAAIERKKAAYPEDKKEDNHNNNPPTVVIRDE